MAILTGVAQTIEQLSATANTFSLNNRTVTKEMAEFNTTDLFLLRIAVGRTINFLKHRFETEQEAALPDVIKGYETTLAKINQQLKEENGYV